MANELFEVEDVKNEFLNKVGAEYAQAFSPKQMELAVYFLNDFCNNLSDNSLVLLRYVPQPAPIQQPQPRQVYQAPAQYQQYPFMPPRYPAQNPFPEEQDQDVREVQQDIQEMNKQLKKPSPLNMRLPPVPPIESDVDLSPEKPKSFVENLQAMKSKKKKVEEDDE